jgi:hypothetical protein
MIYLLDLAFLVGYFLYGEKSEPTLPTEIWKYLSLISTFHWENRNEKGQANEIADGTDISIHFLHFFRRNLNQL